MLTCLSLLQQLDNRGAIGVKVKANDGRGGTKSDEFFVTVSDQNNKSGGPTSTQIAGIVVGAVTGTVNGNSRSGGNITKIHEIVLF